MDTNQQAPQEAIPPKTYQKKRTKIIEAILAFIALVAIIVFIYFSIAPKEKDGQHASDSQDIIAGQSVSSFAKYLPILVTASPSVTPYTIQPDLSNVTNISDFPNLSADQKALLVKNGFFVGNGFDSEFYPVYEANRYNQLPSLVTTDSILHNYHLFFDYLLKTTEEEKLIPGLKDLNQRMLTASLDQYQKVKGTPWENAALRNVGFFAVGSKLLDPSVTVPAPVTDQVSQELALIDAHSGIAVSPLMNTGEDPSATEALKEDYSQYVPRGHYTKSDDLKAYFKSMMWYGRMTFRLKSDDEIRSGILITLALDQNDNQKKWDSLYEPINFFVGKSDDITYFDFDALVEKAYGAHPTVESVAGNAPGFADFVNLTKLLTPPQINSIPIFNSDINPDRNREIEGFRFMGQRFTIDADIFQRLIDRDVPGRMLPKSLDIAAAFGSKEALNLLTQAGDTQYKNYSDNMTKLQSYISGLSETTWTQNLYWSWMYTLQPLLTEKGTGYPHFMQNTAWTRKDLSTFFGSWTELKHDTILYAKQSYAEMGGGEPDQAKDDRGYVEPNPELYARLSALLQMTQDGLDSRGLLDSATKDDLVKMQQLTLSLKTISEKELTNQDLSSDEYELIRGYGGDLEHFWLDVNQKEMDASRTNQHDFLFQNPAAVVADVATDPNGQVLEEGTGHIMPVYAVVPVAGGLRVAMGGVYSYYEFPQPIDNRLTDQAWRDILNSDKIPPVPSWESIFISK